MNNGNGFVPPEAKKKQAASQQGFVPPEVKKKESGQLGLDGSVQPIVSPSTDTKPIFPEGLEPIGAVAEYDKRRDEFVKRERDKFYEEAVSKLPSEQTTVGEDIVNALGAGTTRVVKSLMDTPGYVYNLLAAPQNYIADKYNIPELKASAEILTQQTERFIPDELNTIKAWGELSDKFGGDLEEREKEIQNKYDKSITEYYTNGEYSKGTGLLATRIAESIPYTVSIALTGGLGASPQALMGGIALMEGSQKAQQLREETELNELEIGLNSLASGLMEGVFEQTTAGIGRATRDILAREGKEAAKDFAEKSFKEVSERVLRKYLPATAPIGEGLSEVGTQVSQALIDKFTVDSSINPTEGLMDVFLIGAGSGAAISTPAYVASRFGSKESIDKRNELNKTKDKIDAALQNEELSETVKENLQNKREEIAKAESNILNNDYQKYKGYSEEDLNRVNEINRRLSSIKKTIEEIDDQDIKDSYVSEVENLVNEKTNIEEKYTTQVTKTEEDAIQKRKTEEVPVGEEAQVGEEVVGEVREQAEEVRGEEEEVTEQPIEGLTEGVSEGVTEEVRGEEEVTPERKAELENKQRAENIARKVVDPDFEQLSIEDQNFYEANQELVDSAIQEMQKTKPVEDTKVQSLAEKIVRGAKDFTDEEVDLYAARSEEVEAAKETIASEMEGQKTPPTPQKLLGQIPSKTTKKVDMTDKAVVKQRIQDMVKAANEGYREGRREIKELAKDIKGMMSEVKKGVFTPSQVKALTTRAAEVSTPTQLQKFQDFADKVIESAEYAEDLANAYATRSKVKISNAPSNIQSAFNRFRKVNPSKVDDLAEYNRLAEGLLQYKGKPKVKFQEGVVSAEEKQPIPLREINEYIDKYNNAQAQSIVDDLVSQNELLQQLGLTDEAISPQDAMEIINAITDESPDESVFDRLQDGQRKAEAFKRIVTFNQEDLKNIPQEGITDGDREIKTALENINIDKLRPSQLSGLYTALQNAISNNSYNGAYRFTSIYKAQQNTPKAQNLQETAARDVSSIDFSISNIPSVVRAITGASKSASELQRLSGMFDIFAGSSKAQRGKEIAAQEVKQLIGDKFKTIEENVFLSMYDTLLTVGRENFDYYKRALNEMIQNDLKSQDTETRKSAEVANKVFQDRIADANNINQIKITAKEKKVSDFFGKKFNSIAPRFKEISENVYNIEFIEAENYRPLLWKKRSRSDVEELTSSYYYNQSIRPNKDGSLNQRTLQVDPNTFSFEYDYVNGMVNKYGSQLLDIETAKPIFDYNYFMKSPDSGKAFGSDGNKQAVNERMKMYINSNKNYVQLPASQKLIVDVANKFAKIGARVKLGGVSQVFMQSIPVFARTITILGRDSVMLTDGVAKRVQSNEAFNRLTDNYSISLRGLLRQEFSSVDKTIPKATRQRWKRRIDTTYIGIDDFLDKLQMLPIETADVQTAKTTWFAYYLKSLKDQGLYDGSQSMENLADNPNDEAAAYAEQMIAETQVPSDVNQNGTYLLPEANNPLSLMRRIAFPFITFRTTQAYSIFNSLYTGSKGLKDKKAGKTAFKEISGVMAENTIFAGMSYGRYLLSLTAGAYLASLLDVDIDNDDEETKKEAYTKWWEKAIAQSLAEINPLYGYGIFDGAQVDAMNKFYFTFILTDEQKSKYINDKELRRAKTDKEYNLVIEKGFKNFSKTKNAPVRDFGAKRGDAWYEQLGQLGFLFEIIDQSKETFQMSEQEQYEYISKWNTTVEVPLSEAERQVLLMSAILQTSNLIAPKEFGDIGRRMKSGIIYKDKSSVSPRRGGGRGSSNRSGGR